MIFKFRVIFLMILINTLLFSEDNLFESALSDSIDMGSENKESNFLNLNYKLNGLLKTGVYMKKDFSETNETYFSTSLKLEVNKKNSGKAYTDIRFDDKKNEDNFYLREGFIDIYKKKWDFRIGNQIIVWGRADAINPTDSLTPKDRTIYTYDEDEMRISNFMIKANYNFYPFNLETILIPDYKASETFIPYEYLENYNKTGIALKFNYEYSKIDGSFSYYSGYSTTTGITEKEKKNYLRPYKHNVFGWDFATNFGKNGFRNEFAYKQTKNYKENDYIPNPEINYIAGFDREIIKDVTLIFQYYFKYIIDYKESINLSEKQTAMSTSQTEKVQNSLIYRITWELFYETLLIENLSNYNFDTKEFFTRIKSEYDITDSFVLTTGMDFYFGEDGTLYKLVGDKKDSIFLEIKMEF